MTSFICRWYLNLSLNQLKSNNITIILHVIIVISCLRSFVSHAVWYNQNGVLLYYREGTMKQHRRKPDIQKWNPITTRSGAKTKKTHQGSFHRIVPPTPLHSVSFNIILYGDYWCCVLCINVKFIRFQLFFLLLWFQQYYRTSNFVDLMKCTISRKCKFMDYDSVSRLSYDIGVQSNFRLVLLVFPFDPIDSNWISKLG